MPPREIATSQFGDPQLTAEEAYAACGPAAAVAFARANGQNPTLKQALELAKKVGWSAAGGMNGIGNQLALLGKLGVAAIMEQTIDGAKIARDVMGGNPVTISSAGHYFVASDYDENSKKFYVGTSGTDVRRSAWMSLAEMDQRSRELAGGGLNGVLYLDNPTTPQKSVAYYEAEDGGTSMATVAVGSQAELDALAAVHGGIKGSVAKSSQKSGDPLDALFTDGKKDLLEFTFADGSQITVKYGDDYQETGRIETVEPLKGGPSSGTTETAAQREQREAAASASSASAASSTATAERTRLTAKLEEELAPLERRKIEAQIREIDARTAKTKQGPEPATVASTFDTNSEWVFLNGAWSKNPNFVSAKQKLDAEIAAWKEKVAEGMVITKEDEYRLEEAKAKAIEQFQHNLTVQREMDKWKREQPYKDAAETRAESELQLRRQEAENERNRKATEGQVSALNKQSEAGFGAIKAGTTAGGALVAPPMSVIKMAYQPIQQSLALMNQLAQEGKINPNYIPKPKAPSPEPEPEAVTAGAPGPALVA